MPSVKIVFREERVYSDGASPVMLRVTAHRRTAERQLFSLSRAEWNPKTLRVRGTGTRPTALNKIITTRLREAEKLILDRQAAGHAIDAREILDAVWAGQNYTFTGHFRTYIQARADRGQLSTADLYAQYLRRLLAFTNKREITFAEFSESFINRLIKHWREESVSMNSIIHRLAVFRCVYNDALRRNLTKGDPFAFIDLKKTRVRKQKLTTDEIQRLADLDLKPNSTADHARNCFLIQFYLRGLRISEVLLLTRDNVLVVDGEPVFVQFTSLKTGELMSVRLHEKARRWLRPYLSASTPFLLPFLRWVYNPRESSDANERRLLRMLKRCRDKINRYLLKLETALAINKPIRTHIARHSFAHAADKKHPDKRKISRMLGQRNPLTIETYLAELRDDELDEAAAEVFD